MKFYPQYPNRQSQLLDGAWDFHLLDENQSLDDIRPEAIVYDDLMSVPGVFDTCPEYFGKRGTGVYRRKISLPAHDGSRLRLRIGGMGLRGRIWWDGCEIGRYELPYSTVNFDFSSEVAKEHELVIAVDNRFDSGRCVLFSPDFDFYGYGGIYRSVELQQLPDNYLERVRISTRDIESKTVNLEIIPGDESGRYLEFSVAFDGDSPRSFRKPVVNGVVLMELLVPNGKIWSPETPNLHTVTVSTGTDCVVERFGIRTVKTSGQNILLNDEPLYLLGVNRHESHPEFGPVQPAHLMLDDLRLLKDLGCNFVRCVHYPQDQLFLDLCDQLGILVWQESMGWNNPEEDALDPLFFDLQVQQTDLMVKNSINHPSIIIWGFLNECCSDTEGGKRLYRALTNTIKSVDRNLLISFASNKKEKDICFEFADVIAMNMYPGWLEGIENWTTSSKDWIAPFIAKKAEFANRDDLSDKPFIIAEIGACGLYGIHDQASAQWSEEYQADYFSEACRSIIHNPRYAGLALWQMFDTRSYVNAGQVRTKPRGFNCAGLLDEYRRPKLAYDAVKKVFAKVRPLVANKRQSP